MTEKHPIRWLTATFASTATERAYLNSSNHNNKKSDITLIICALGMFAVYGFVDIQSLQHGYLSALARLIIFCVASGALLIAYAKQRYEFVRDIAVVAMTVAGLFLSLVIYFENDPTNEYYKGIVQLALTTTILVRVGFAKWATALFIILVCFYISTAQIYTGQRYVNILLFVTSVSFICAFGVYNLERARRKAFLLQLDLQDYSEKLEIAAATATRNAQNRGIMIKLLAHFYKTPVHQIKGYSEILRHNSDQLDDETSAVYLDEVIHATEALSRFTSKLLRHNAFGDSIDQQQYRNVSTMALFQDIMAAAKLVAPVQADIENFYAHVPNDILYKAIDELVENVKIHAGPVTMISMECHQVAQDVVILIQDDGVGLTKDQFEQATMSFYEIEDYLSIGEKIPMGLRYVSKVIDLMQGKLEFIMVETGTCLKITFPINALGEASPQTQSFVA